LYHVEFIKKKKDKAVEINDQKQVGRQQKILFFSDGKIYFTRKTERWFFFVLTIIMLVCGVFAKSGLF